MLVKTRTQFRKMLTAIKRSKELVVDTETTGLRPYGGDRIIGYAIRTSDGQTWYAPLRHRKGKNLPEAWIPELVEPLSNPDVLYIGWNYKFDLLMMKQDGIPFPHQMEDVMLAHHLYDENRQSFALKTTGALLLGADSDKEQQDLKAKLKALGFKDSGSMCELPPEDVHAYAEKDVELTWNLREWVKPRLQGWEPSGVNQWDYYKDVCEFALVCAKMESHGLLVDQDLMKVYHQEAIDVMDPMLQKLREIAGFQVNPNSYIQNRTALFSKGSDKAAVQDIIDKGPTHRGYNYAVLFQEFQTWKTVERNYYRKYPGLIDLDGRIRTSYKLHGTVTGRLSAVEPNLQQVKGWAAEGPGKVKEIFVAPKGKLFISADYSQAELRILGHYTQDPNFLKAFEEDIDLHQIVADAMGVSRKVAKNINFGAGYGVGAKALAALLRIKVSEAQKFLDAYHATNPGIRKLYRTCEAVARKKGYLQLWTGRVRHFDGTPNAPFHKAMPNLIQGGAAELIRISATRLDKELDNGCPMVLQVHDQLVFEVDEDKVDRYIPTIRQVMTDFSGMLRVPMKVDVSVGKNWGALKDYPLTLPEEPCKV